jgi:hypothetical protein
MHLSKHETKGILDNSRPVSPQAVSADQVDIESVEV